MQFYCEKCSAQYVIPDDKLGKHGARVRCKKCGNVITVRPKKEKPVSVPMTGPAFAQGPAPQPAPTAPPVAVSTRDDQSTGQVPRVELGDDHTEQVLSPLTQENELEDLYADKEGVEDIPAFVPKKPAEPPPTVEQAVNFAAFEPEGDPGEPPPPPEEPTVAVSAPQALAQALLEKQAAAVNPAPVPQPVPRPAAAAPKPAPKETKPAAVESARKQTAPPVKETKPPAGQAEAAPLKPAGTAAEIEKALANLSAAIPSPEQDGASTEFMKTRIMSDTEQERAAVRGKAKPAPPPPPAKEPEEEEASWYAAIDEKQTGPLAREVLEKHWRKGELTPDSLVWAEGFDGWTPLAQVKELKFLLAIPQPRAAVEEEEELPPMPELPKEDEKPFPEEKASGGDDWLPAAGSALKALAAEELRSLAELEKDSEQERQDRAATEAQQRQEAEKRTAAEKAKAKAERASEEAAELEEAEEKPRVDQDKTVLRPPPAPSLDQLPAPFRPAQASVAGAKTAYYEPSVIAKVRGAPGASKRVPKWVWTAAAGAGAMGLILVGVLLGREGPPPPATGAPPAAAASATPSAPPAAAMPAVAQAPQPASPTALAQAATPTAMAAVAPVAPAAGQPPPEAREGGRKRGREREAGRRGQREEPSAPPRGRQVAAAPPPPPPPQVAAAPAASRGAGGGGDILDFDNASGGSGAPAEDDRILTAVRAGDRNRQRQQTAPREPPPPAPAPERQRRTLSKESVKATIKRNFPIIQKCMAEQRRLDPAVRGTMKVSWKIMPSGETTAVQTADPQFRRTFISGCATAAIKKWKFDQFDGDAVPITFPFNLK